jgi:hypothetical protein
MAKTRKCKVVVDGAFQEATFHQFQKKIVYGSDNEPRECTVAVVELSDGRLVNYEPTRVRFLDESRGGDDEHEGRDGGRQRVTSSDLQVKVEKIKSILVARARGETAIDEEYTALRRELVATPAIKAALPSFVVSCRTVLEFWRFIQPKFPTYKERTDFLQQEFELILSALEKDALPETEVGDLFRRQFPAGLPFGLTKPHVVMKPQGGTQVIQFEDAAEVGVIRSSAYPSLVFAGLQTAVSGTPVARTRLDEKLVALIQTDYEKTFFREYTTTYAMFTADVPVLVPQAWIQWHSLKKEDLRAAGSPYAAELYRVDFVAFWKNKRFAILIDDISHYAVRGAGRWDANEMQYSNRLKEDRKLRKEGWDVFRVSNWEIRNGGLPDILTDLREFITF